MPAPLPAEKYINREVSLTLDSTDAFEGPEKLLEIWYANSKESLPTGMFATLRSIPRSEWVSILDRVQCKVLSQVKTDTMDAYVLSESSLFVFDHKIILKTCGTTTLLHGIEPLIKAVETYCGFPANRRPYRVFYSHKDFMFPTKQQTPHTSWDTEVYHLDELFAPHGRAYIVGNIKHDHWYLYATTAPELMGDEFDVVQSKNGDHEDETLELFMTELSPGHAVQFCTNRTVPDKHVPSTCGAPVDDEDPGHHLGNITTKFSGIDDIYPTPNQLIDAFSFAPCGYSCNGLVNQGNYFTIHVTPEDGFSYASFETNVPAREFNMTNSQVIERAVNIFRPGRFSATYFTSHSSPGSCASSGVHTKTSFQVSGYRLSEQITYSLDGYDLIFVSFEAIRSLK